VFVLFFVGSCLNPPYPDFLLAQHLPTLAGVIALPYVSNRLGMSRGSFTAIVVFLSLHTLGARYLYSYVPYDAWSERLFGFSVGQALGLERNHFDRLVHFCYGLLCVFPIHEFERRHLGLSPAWASVLAVECVLATSAAFELTEWLVAIMFTPAWAEKFLGMQGDVFDAQKDMALATAGAMLSMGALAVCHGLGHRRSQASIERT
jgi:putative membrane protein